MRSAHRSVLAVTTVAVAATVLTACGSGAGATASSAGDTITVLDYWGDEPNNTMFEEFLSTCSSETGFTFERLSVPQGELITRASQLTASGDGPGMIVSDNNQVPTLAEAGVLAPFDIATTGLQPGDFLEGPYSSATFEGVQYGLPVGNNGEVIVYNTQMLADAGIDPPRTWSELRQAAAVLTAGDVHGFGVTMTAGETSTWNFLPQLWSNGGTLADLTSPEAVEALDFWTSFIREGTAPRASLDWESTELEAQFAAGKLAMAQIGTWMLPTLAADAQESGLEYGQMQQVAPDGKELVTPFGGEVLTVGSGVEGEAAQAVTDCIASFVDPETLVERSGEMGYVPSYTPVIDEYIVAHPELQTLADQLQNSRSRTAEVGADYPTYSTALAAAIQQAATGARTPQEALAEAAAASRD